MNIIRDPVSMYRFSRAHVLADKTVGLVPTMGALHEGHLSLVERARRECDVVVMSLFVNPLQFAPTEDLARYPRPFDRDCELARQAGCAALFAPSPAQMYPPGFQSSVEVGKVGRVLEGAIRPDHFRGVTTVVLKLFNIVMPQVALFGHKDAQQVVVIRRMVEDLCVPVRLIVAPTLREKDGLALSSRNVYLDAAERNQAPCISQGLLAAQRSYASGERSAAALQGAIEAVCAQADLLEIQYIAVVHPGTLEPLVTVTEGALLAVACRTRISGTRLIDNCTVGCTL